MANSLQQRVAVIEQDVVAFVTLLHDKGLLDKQEQQARP